MTENFKPHKANNQTEHKYSPEEWAEKKQAEKDDIYKRVDETALDVVSNPEHFENYLNTQSRLDRYSAVNTLLIYSQKPEASQLKSYADWAQDNVRVKRGEKSISMLEPTEYIKKDGSQGIAYNVKKVFDVSQTSGRRASAPTANRNPRELVKAMVMTSEVDVQYVDSLPYEDRPSYYDNDKQTLYIKKGNKDTVALCQSVAQELGYAQLSMNSDVYSRRDLGFNAACIGYMLCKKYGVEAQAFNISDIPDKLRNAEPKEIKRELSGIRQSMNEIATRVTDELYRQKQARSQEMAR